MRDCPNGHRSASADYCDQCGAVIGAVRSAVPRHRGAGAEPAPAELTCRGCGRSLDGRFCEHCGHDSLAAVDPGPSGRAGSDPPRHTVTWSVLAAADRTYFDAVLAVNGPDAATVTFPPFCPERRFPLRGGQALVGRRNRRRGIEPEIDLTGPPEDPGVSHSHAMLVAQPDGSWAVVDLGSANGTYLDGDHGTPIRPNTPVPIGDGGRLHVGAWTVLTLRAHRGRPA
jgi:hypothetical protein